MVCSRGSPTASLRDMRSEDDERCPCRCHSPTSIFGVRLVDELEATIACADCKASHVRARLALDQPLDLPEPRPFDPEKEY